MKKNVTYIDPCHFEKLILASGLPYLAQKGFVKISGAKGRNVYVANGKAKVGRVDISGFTSPTDGCRAADEAEVHGSVSQMLDFSRTQDEILSAFADLLEHLASLPAAEPVKRVMKKKANAAVGWTVILPAPEAAELQLNDEAQ